MTNAHILLVEDSESLRNVLAEKLRAENFDIREAANAEDALKDVETNKPDAIITDIVMFPIDGISFITKIRGMGPWGASVHVIALTNSRDKSPQAADLHLDAYLIKAETSLDEVVNLVKELFIADVE